MWNPVCAAPEDATLHTNLGLCMMEQGDLANGTIEYEWRLRRPGAPRINAPLWDGKPLAGRTLLLWADSGVADGMGHPGGESAGRGPLP